MSLLGQVYHHSLGLLTDLYQLTMAYALWCSGRAERETVFHLFFRRNPFGGGYTVACGAGLVPELLEAFRFDGDDLAYLAGLTGDDQQPLFADGFLRALETLRFTGQVDAVPEGTVVFPREPLLRVQGPHWQCQIVETALLNLMNFQSLVATKAARICSAAGGPVLEFGLRRAQGIDGGLSASRAAFVGGCVATSNVLAGKLLGIPVKGTHAHSWVMAFESELEAFESYADAMPNNCVLLVDTYDSLEGVRRAIRVGRRLRKVGHRLAGIRLDSGDLAYLSREARRMLDEAGLSDTAIVASNDLDEHLIESLHQQEAAIGVWGVGTKLVTGGDQSALGGVYKLAAVRREDGSWRYPIKLSEQAVKISEPGVLAVRRYREGSEAVCDVIYDELLGVPPDGELVDPLDMTRRRRIPQAAEVEELLEPLIRRGRVVAAPPAIAAARERCQHQLEGLHSGVKRFLNPHQYPVGLERRLFDRRTELILAARKSHGGDADR